MKSSHSVGVRVSDDAYSTVWNFATNRADVFISAAMFNGDIKVTLHASGECHFSRPNEWVVAAPGRTNQERHIVKWTIDRTYGTTAEQVFTVRIPRSEIRPGLPLDPDLKSSALWLSAPGRGYATDLVCYLTPPSDRSDPAILAKLPGRLVVSMRLADTRWFTVVTCAIPAPSSEVESIRRSMIVSARQSTPDYRPTASQRGAGLMEVKGKKDLRGLVELRPLRL